MLTRKLITLFGLICLTASLGCNPQPSSNAGSANAPGNGEALVRVKPIHPASETFVRYTEQPGQISAIEEAPIFARVSGYVRKVHVDIGDKVTGPVYEGEKLITPGQKLLEIEVPELQNDLAQRQAAVEQVKSEIKQSEAAIKVAQAMKASAAADVTEAQAMIERVEAERERWQAELDRITDLADRQAVTVKLVDETKSKSRAAAAAVKEITAKVQSAEAHLKEAEALVEKATADAAATMAKLAVSSAELDRSTTLLNYATLHAPFSGVVTARNVDAGHLVSGTVQTKEPLLIVVRPETVRVYVDVPEVDAVHIEPGIEAQLRVASLAATEFTGKVTRTTWVLHQSARTLRTEIDVPNADLRLRPGMYASARIKVAERKNAVVIPKTAVVSSAGQSHIWKVAADGTLSKQAIEVGLEAGGKVEALTGLQIEDSIIGLNPSAFRAGQKVEVVPASK